MNKVIILLGPTGVGKTSLSLLLAKTLHTEIISADSMQIYRYMDIGTAKPSPADRKMITHHMIGIVEPWETFSTGKYIASVKPIIDNLLEKGKIPIITGGTGLYIKAMTRGIFSGPSADWTLREELLAIEQETKGTLYDCLKTLDPVAAGKITPNDMRRIIRALEVCLRGGAKMSDFQQKLTCPLPYEFLKIGITRERKELYRLIETRVDEMMNAGLLEEVKTVINLIAENNRLRRGRCEIEDKKNNKTRSIDSGYANLPSMQAIGYKEIVRHLRGEIPLQEAINLIKKASKRYAKRQFTWFKKEADVRWVDVTGITDPHKVFAKIYPLIVKELDIDHTSTLQY